VLLEVRQTDVDVGILTKNLVTDFTQSLNSVTVIVSSSIKPNAPVSDLNQVRDSRSLVSLVSDRYTTYYYVPSDSGGSTVAVIGVVVVVLLGACIYYCCSAKKTLPLPPPITIAVTQGNQAPPPQGGMPRIEPGYAQGYPPVQGYAQAPGYPPVQGYTQAPGYPPVQGYQQAPFYPPPGYAPGPPPPSAPPFPVSAAGAMRSALDTIRISKENYKPFIKTT
jgi:hypothetical protein